MLAEGSALRRERDGLAARWYYLIGAVLILVGIGTALYQMWPDIAFRLGLIEPAYPYACALPEADDAGALTNRTPRDIRLVIPKIAVDQQVFEGDSEQALESGVYHHADSAAPGEGDNVVIAGHRVRRAFTLLYRLEPGDPVLLYWNGTEHDYRVDRVFTVGPDDTTILDPTDAEQLTLYTCRPRFLGNTRTVVTALPAEE